jgi:hypothetical protein
MAQSKSAQDDKQSEDKAGEEKVNGDGALSSSVPVVAESAAEPPADFSSMSEIAS